MSVYISLSFQKKKQDYNRNDEITVVVYYYHLGRKIKITSGIKVKLKDWDFEWEKKQNKNPIKNSDEYHLEKSLLIKQKVKEIEDIVHKINLNFEIPTTDLVKSYLNNNYRKKKIEGFKNLDFLFVLNEYREFISQKSTLREGYKKTLKSNLSKIEEFVNHYHINTKYKITINDIDDKELNYLDKIYLKINKLTKLLMNDYASNSVCATNASTIKNKTSNNIQKYKKYFMKNKLSKIKIKKQFIF